MNIIWDDETKEKMMVNEKEGVTYLSYKAFEQIPGIVHGFSTRLGGVSEGVCSSMNLSFSRGDREDSVRENYRRISQAIGFDWKNIVMSDQTHTANVRVITEEDRGNGITRSRAYTDVDGMVTNVPGLVLTTFYADCVPLYFVDPINRAVGLSHSGWRGTVGRIGEATVKKMTEMYGSRPEEMYSAIGPSICQKCYEVSEDVIHEFSKAFDVSYHASLFYRKDNGKYQLDLWEANRIIMMEAGICREHISMPNLCTCHNPEFLFSHRASGGKRGNLAAFLGIK